MRRSCVFLLLLAACSSGGIGETDGDGQPPAGVDTDGDAGLISEEPDAGTPDAGSTELDAGNPDSGAPVEELPDPIEAPTREWTWVDIPGARCANGSSTGIGVNFVDDSPDKVLIFLQGGGACWDGASCWGPVNTAFFVATGYGHTEFAVDPMRPVMLPLRRDDPFNPFKDMNIIYVPYCTGDVHAGSRVTVYEYLGTEHITWHVGARNLDLILEHMAATFPALQRIWLAGDSAGGFGSALNMDRVQTRFPQARVDVLDDSGQPIPPDPARWQSWKEAWDLQVPADCPECLDDVTAFADYLRVKYPENRFGLISYSHDSVITTFIGLLPTTFWDELQALAALWDDEWPNGRYYFLAGALHVALAAPTPGVIEWVTQMVTDDPAWENRMPLE